MYPLTKPDDVTTALIVVAAAASLHASFQLSGSVMTRMSSHNLGAKRSHRRLIHLCLSYLLGNVAGIALLGFATTYIISGTFSSLNILWSVVSGIGVATGLLLFWYNVHTGSRSHWLPLGASSYLFDRASKTRRGFEASALGTMTAAGEIPFVIAPLLLLAMILHGNPDLSRLGVIASYVVIASLPLLITFIAVGSGVKVSRLETWRDNNHRFLTGTCAAGLLVLSMYAFSLFGVHIEGIRP